jgi:ring-1,2-phenylacetyl-CoA epoxidase subunit PaaC
MSTGAAMGTDVVEFALRVGDDALIAAQRLAEWSSRAPEMEEDVALANIALDQLGVARLMLTKAGEWEGAGRDEDALAFLRAPDEFRNCLLVELPNAGPAAAAEAPGDFAVTMVKLLFLSAYQMPFYDGLAGSVDEYLAGVGAKARKESAYHLDHATQWTVRLGDGTEESHRRMQAAVDDLWPYTEELFAVDPVTARLEGAGLALSPVHMRPQWSNTVAGVLAEATLTAPAEGQAPSGGRKGRHTEHLGRLLTEMQSLHRAHPGARW